ncbi:MAG: hypothetical protein BRC48_05565 [Cyanobacteria bacterium QS_9_48_30]|nr:MAG: hypothetical protein BRC48_05565 [Cyanobacteria bacterium QS_9_48_30]
MDSSVICRKSRGAGEAGEAEKKEKAPGAPGAGEQRRKHINLSAGHFRTSAPASSSSLTPNSLTSFSQTEMLTKSSIL